jgi:serine/threonine protein kinase/tetratricopeptide (TPR) repeat protein
MPAREPKAEQILLSALEITGPEERRAHLDQACGADAVLRRAVEALLQAHLGAGNSLEQPAAAPVLTTSDGPPADSPSDVEAPGSRVGPYKLLQEIGKGGMGVVYMAEQEQPIRRRVAVKIIKPGMDSAQVVARFEAERQALALMDHINIAKVLDAGATATGRPFFVMELVHGIPLTRYCDDNHLTPRERLELFVPVCQAIQHAHQKGIIHRDIKPSNVLVTLYDGKPVPKVIDFGLAKATEQRLTDKTMFTQFGTMVGTLEYMSPEQAEMSALGVDTRSDIYSLGVLLYELLTGTTPLDRHKLRAAGFTELLRIIREDEPPKPSTRLSETAERLASIAAHRKTDPAKLSKLLRGELDWIVMKALEKDRGRRYETANGFARDVQRYLTDESVEACPPSAGYRLRRFVRKHRVGLAMAATLVTLLVLGGVVSSWQAVRATRAEGLAKERLADVTREKDRADAAGRIAQTVNEFLQQDLLRQADSREQAYRGFAADPNLTVKEALNRAAAKIGDRFREQPLVEAAIQRAIGDAYRGVGEAQRGLPHLERSWVLRQAHVGPEDPDTLDSLNSLARAYSDLWQLDRALQLFEQVLAKRTEKLGPDHPDTLGTMQSLGWVCYLGGQEDRAASLFEQVLAKRTEKLGPDHPDTLGTMHSLCLTYERLGQVYKAVSLQAQEVAKRREKLGPNHPDTLASMQRLADTYMELGQLDKALPLIKESLAKQKEILGPDHSETLWGMCLQAFWYERAGQFDKFVQLLEQTLEKCQVKFGPDHPHTLRIMGFLALAYMRAERLDKAVPLCEQTLEKQIAKLDRDNPETFFLVSIIGDVYRAAMRPADAVRLLEPLVERCQTKRGRDNPITLSAMNNLALAYMVAGRMPEAVRLFEETLSLLNARLGPDHPETLNTTNNLGEAYRAAMRPADAIRLLEPAIKRCQTKLGRDHHKILNAMNKLALAYEVAGRVPEAEPLYRQLVAQTRKQFGAEDPRTTSRQALLGRNLLLQQKYHEAEIHLRECLVVQEKKQPDLWTTFNTKSMLGGALLGQKKHAEAEPLLLGGYEGMKQRQDKIPPHTRSERLTESLEQLVQLYNATGKNDKVAEWRKKLEEAKAPP